MPALFLLALLVAATSLADEVPRLAWPVDCAIGESCWIPLHVDHAPETSVLDYACGALAYDGHDGTDIAIRDLAAMEGGIDVLAAADGIVRGIRDGMADVDVREIGPDAVAGRECGNGVVVEHGGGLSTQYSHMREGSVRVRPGEIVRRGDPLGQVGMSGLASFPHLHLTVRHEGRVVDPFVGLGEHEGCGLGEAPLWAEPEAVPYLPVMITGVGFADRAPEQAEIREGLWRQGALPAEAPALVVWMAAYGIAAGDEVTLRLRAPDGAIAVEDVRRRERGQPWSFAFAGRRLTEAAWPQGDWRGEAVVRRGSESFRVERRLEVR
jgi:hypothetical protein